MHSIRNALLTLAAATRHVIFASPTASAPLPAWTLLPNTTYLPHRGLSAVSDSVAWVAGARGNILRTTDAGATWTSLFNLDSIIEFRDVSAFSESHAIILSIGNGNASRIYSTTDGGASWALGFMNEDERAFYNCIAFESPETGLAISDPVEGKFRLLKTTDGGKAWTLVDPAGMPPARDGEFNFAASGQCLTFGGGGRYYAASGGLDPGRIFRSGDSGATWAVTDTPIAGGEAAGVFSVVFRDSKHGIAVGGDYLLPNKTSGNAAWSGDGGVTWTPATVFPAGYRSGVAWVPGRCNVAIAVGPSGSDITRDGGRTWTTFDTGSFDSVECPSKEVCWASGERGRIARLVFSA